MRYNHHYLPNGQKVDVTPVFQGFKFAVENASGGIPPEWTVSLRTIHPKCRDDRDRGAKDDPDGEIPTVLFTEPSLESDVLYLSSMSMPATGDLKPGSASARQIALVLWVTFSWYFHEPEPNHHVSIPGSSDIPEPGRVKKDWRVEVQSKGMLGGKDKMVKLERLGLVACQDASVGGRGDFGEFDTMFISQKAFWQLDPRLYLVSLTAIGQPPGGDANDPVSSLDAFGPGFPFGAGPNTFGMFLPTYYPPQPLQYTVSEHARHPIRPKGYRQGEVFYVRYIPSGNEYLTLRVPVLPHKQARLQIDAHVDSEDHRGPDLCIDKELKRDVELLHTWMEQKTGDTTLMRKGPITAQTEFLKERLSSQNSFPALACWDSTPNGYFELFWVLEDWLGRLMNDVNDWDRGIRCFIGNADFLTPYYMKTCLSSLVHHCLLYDQRTQTVVFDVRADNMKYALFLFVRMQSVNLFSFISSLESIGFRKDREVNFPHERNMILKIRRDEWVAPTT